MTMFPVTAVMVAQASPSPSSTPAESTCPATAGQLYVKFPDRVNYTDGQHMSSSFILSVHGDGSAKPLGWFDAPDLAPMKNAIADFISHIIICGDKTAVLDFLIGIDHATGNVRETVLQPPGR